MSIKITTLIENNLNNNHSLSCEHGLSLLIDVDGVNILFDTGQSGEFIKNAEKLNVSLNKLDYVLLSHGHYDHSGGFKKLVEKIENSFKLVVGNNFFDRKYRLKDGLFNYNGNEFDESYISKKGIDVEYISSDVFYISDAIMVFRNFKRNNEFEKIDENLKTYRNNKYELDDFSDEIVLAIKTTKGLVVVLGCSHVGCVNILETIIKKTKMNVFGIIGGTHLVNADENRIDNTISYFKEKNIKLIGLSHCTGKEAITKFKDVFNNEFFNNNTGDVIIL